MASKKECTEYSFLLRPEQVALAQFQCSHPEINIKFKSNPPFDVKFLGKSQSIHNASLSVFGQLLAMQLYKQYRVPYDLKPEELIKLVWELEHSLSRHKIDHENFMQAGVELTESIGALYQESVLSQEKYESIISALIALYKNPILLKNEPQTENIVITSITELVFRGATLENFKQELIGVFSKLNQKNVFLSSENSTLKSTIQHIRTRECEGYVKKIQQIIYEPLLTLENRLKVFYDTKITAEKIAGIATESFAREISAELVKLWEKRRNKCDDPLFEQKKTGIASSIATISRLLFNSSYLDLYAVHQRVKKVVEGSSNFLEDSKVSVKFTAVQAPILAEGLRNSYKVSNLKIPQNSQIKFLKNDKKDKPIDLTKISAEENIIDVMCEKLQELSLTNQQPAENKTVKDARNQKEVFLPGYYNQLTSVQLPWDRTAQTSCGPSVQNNESQNQRTIRILESLNLC